MSNKRWLAAVAVASFWLLSPDPGWAAEGDLDDDSIPDAEESGDSDADGLPDAEDADDDDDGVPSLLEVQRAPASGDTDGDGLRDYLDTDDDGDELDTPLELGAGIVPRDTDADQRPDYLDSDDDNDGELTSVERASAPPEPDVNENGVPDHLDAQAFGSQAAPEGCERLLLAGKSFSVCWDIDQDGDGLRSQFEASAGLAVDTDGDGMPDFLDADDDGDGLSSAAENCDPNHDGTPDDAQRTGVNAYDYLMADDDEDAIATRDERPGNVDRDTDSDGTPDHRDDDDDGDGVPTLIEVGDLGPPLDTDMNGTPDYLQAGVKAGEGPGGLDGGIAPDRDAGVGALDASVSVDSGAALDAGSSADAAARSDAASDREPDADDEEELPGQSGGKDSGCSAQPGAQHTSHWLLAGLCALGLVWTRRRAR